MVMGPGGRQIQMPAPSPSNWVCPSCGFNPPIANDPKFPFGTPMSNITQLQGEEPWFHCPACYSKFQLELTRANVPVLRRKEELAAQAEQTVEPEYTVVEPEEEQPDLSALVLRPGKKS